MKPDVEDSFVANETSYASAKTAIIIQPTTLTVDYQPYLSNVSSAPHQSASEGPYSFACGPHSLSTKIVLIVTVFGISKVESRRIASADSHHIGLHPRSSTSMNPMPGRSPSPLGSGTSAQASKFCDHVHSIEHPVTRFAYCGSRKHHHYRTGRTCSRR